MKTHLNTLFVTTEGSYLAKDGRAVAVRVEKATRLRVPLHNLDGIVCLGRVGASPSLLGAAAEAGVRVSFLSARGRFLAAVQGFTAGNVLLRREQYRAADDPARSAAVARSVVLGKLANGRTVLLRAAREAADPARADRLPTACGPPRAGSRSASARPGRAGRSTPSAAWKARPGPVTSGPSTTSSGRRTTRSGSPAAAAGRRSTA